MSMGKRIGFGDYLREAFNARPFGLLIPPNWIAPGVFALLGIKVDPGFLVLGAGLELGYLFALANNSRFQRLITGKALTELGHLQGRSNKLAVLAVFEDSPTDNRAWTEWVVQGQPGDKISVDILSDRAGNIRTSVTL